MPKDARWATRPYDGYAINRPLAADAELTRVGPGTPCGDYMRRFWHPVAMASRLGDVPLALRRIDQHPLRHRRRPLRSRFFVHWKLFQFSTHGKPITGLGAAQTRKGP